MILEYSPTYSILKDCPSEIVEGLSLLLEHGMSQEQLLPFINSVGKPFPFTKSYAFKATLDEDTGKYNVKFYSGFLRTVLNFLNNRAIRPTITTSRSKYICSDKEASDVLRPHQKRIVANCISKKRGIVKSPTGCHIKGTKVLMYNGTFKQVEDVKVNDLLMGPDNKPRKVLSLCRGRGPIYKLSSSSVRTNKFKDLFVNDEHILSLKHTQTDKIINISVKEYLAKSNWFKHCYKLYINNKQLTFNTNSNLDIDPYFLGLYLGDRYSNYFAITTADKVVEDYCIDYLGEPLNIVSNNNCKTLSWSKKNNYKLNYLRQLGLNIKCGKNALTCATKFIPLEAKTSTVENRLQLLAGLIDSSGWLEKNHYCFVSKSKQLAEDFAFVGRSLGFYCRFKEESNGYYLVVLLGNINLIPVKLERKQYNSPQLRNKSCYKYGFNLEYVKQDDFYGFNLDNDNLYLLEEFIVTHNSGKSFAIAELIRKFNNDGLKVLVTVPTISLLDQMTNDIHNFRKLHGCEPIEIGRVGDGSFDFKDVTVGIPNSLSKVEKTGDYLATVDALLSDEVQTTANATYAAVIEHLTNRAISIGFSATPWTADGSNILLEAFYGNQIVEISESEMIAKDIIMEPFFEFYSAPAAFIPNSIAKHASNISSLTDAHRYKTLASVYNYVIINNKARNTMIVNKAIERINLGCGPVLIIVNKVKGQHNHADVLTELFESKGVSLPTISGYISKKKKESLINDLKECKIPGAIAGPKVLSAGISIHSLSTIILAGAGRSDSEFIQRVGRLLRKKEGKERPLVIDFQDPQYWFASQSRSRIETAESIYGPSNIILR